MTIERGFGTREEAERQADWARSQGYRAVEVRGPAARGARKGTFSVHYHKRKIYHDDVVKTLAEELKKKFEKLHVSTKRNNLPRSKEGGPEEPVYRPDIIVCEDEETKANIKGIVEVETTSSGKSVVGAILLADYCIGKNIDNKIQSPDIKPWLVFVMLRGIELMRKRAHISEGRRRHIEKIYCVPNIKKAIEKIESLMGDVN